MFPFYKNSRNFPFYGNSRKPLRGYKMGALARNGFISFLPLCKKVSNLEALRIYSQIWIYCVAYVQVKFLFENHFDKHQPQTDLLYFFIHVCIVKFFHQCLATTQFSTYRIHAHRFYLYPLLLCYIILMLVLRIPILFLNFMIQHPRNSETLKYPT